MDHTANPTATELVKYSQYLPEVGITRTGVEKPASNSNTPTGVVRVLPNDRNGNVQSWTSQERAYEIIMRKNMFGVQAAIKHLGINPSKFEIDALTRVSFSENKLDLFSDTHILVAAFPMSILEMQFMFEKEILFKNLDSWWPHEPFKNEQGQPGWYLIRKTQVKHSAGRKWDDQLLLLDENDIVPSAQLLFYTIIAHYMATGERLFENTYVRTASRDTHGDHIMIGWFHTGVWVKSIAEHKLDQFIGLASARKCSV